MTISASTHVYCKFKCVDNGRFMFNIDYVPLTPWYPWSTLIDKKPLPNPRIILFLSKQDHEGIILEVNKHNYKYKYFCYSLTLKPETS